LIALAPAAHPALSWGATALADVLRPPEDLSPSEFAAKYRRLKKGTTFRHGAWSNEVFPYLVAIMDAVQEAIRTGKNLVLMKSGQGGGSEAMINALLWLKVHYPGPILYLIDTISQAEEFSRDRFDYANQTCAPVAKKSLRGYGSGDTLLKRRYTDGKLALSGGQSILTLQSEPYRIVFIDEADSLLATCPDGDPFEIAEIRTDAFPGETLTVAFAHPTTETRGAGKIYYQKSDQRRGHVWCPICKVERFWLNWEGDVKVEPHPGQTRSEAERDASAYVYRTPCCNGVLTDALRWTAVANGCEQISTISPEIAARKSWIGVHFNQLYMSNKTLTFLAEKWIDGIGDSSVRRVWINKRGGDVYKEKSGNVSPAAWGRLRQDYGRGELPSWASFLTAGVDVNSRHVHFALWAWGLRLDAHARRRLCGALIEWGELKRVPASLTLDPADLSVLDFPLLEQAYLRPDGSALRARQVYVDSGWQGKDDPLSGKGPAVYEFCREARHRERFVPIKGGSDDSRSKAAQLRWSKVPPYMADGVLLDPGLKLGLLNTYRAKLNLFDLVEQRLKLVDERTGELVESPRLVLPHDVEPRFLDQSGSEHLKTEGSKTFWVHRGANHFSDCNVYAFVGASNLSVLQRGKTAKEAKHAQQRKHSPEALRAQAAAAEEARRQSFKRAPGARRGRRIRRSY